MLTDCLRRELVEEDANVAAKLLGLKAGAFRRDDDDRRLEAFKTLETSDIIACPGSGKTTLLVAKLASMIEMWSCPLNGICVLSHTNKAGDEIAEKLGKSPCGYQLSAYPHYVGTIHGFVNQFLTMPWMRSLGYNIQCVDTEIALAVRRGLLPGNIQAALNQPGRGLGELVIESTDFKLATRQLKDPEKPMYKSIQNACRESLERGYCTYEDTFVWAMDCLDKCPSIRNAIRQRFPVLFIDEAQDTSEGQSAILHQIFMAGPDPVVRQRFGDPNQAIFSSPGGEAVTTDVFPGTESRIDLLSSHRFGPAIASVASSLECSGGTERIDGVGPAAKLEKTGDEIRPKLMVIDPEHVPVLLDAYGAILCDHFSDGELSSGVFYAVGQTHLVKPDEKQEHFPKHVSHYCDHYDGRLSRSSSSLRTLVEYVQKARAALSSSGELGTSVDLVAEGIWRIAKAVDLEVVVPRVRRHRRLLEVLAGHDGSVAEYQEMVQSLLLEQIQLDAETWNTQILPVCRRLIKIGVGHEVVDDKLGALCGWMATTVEDAGAVDANSKNNIFVHEAEDGRSVQIQLGSIHSVKGMTHHATLVLETYWHEHNLADLLPVLLGKEQVGTKKRRQVRCKVHYVAVSRPSHLLCVAVQRKDFDRIKDAVAMANKAGWDVVDMAEFVL